MNQLINKYKGILYPFILSIFFSLPLYLNFFEIKIPLLDTIISLFSLYYFVKLPNRYLKYFGFFIGVFWFWWISSSLYYYNLSYLIPIGILFFGFVFYLVFYIFRTKILRILIVILLSLDLITLLEFNYFKLDIIFVNSYIYPSVFSLSIILISFYLYQKFNKKIFFILLLLVFYKPNNIKEPNIKINIVKTHISQDKKWDKKYKEDIIKYNLNIIQNSIDKYDLVILPETAFPFILKYDKSYYILKELSKKIDIIVGSLDFKNNIVYNSTYFFSKSKVKIAHKVILVPFGEKIPLPKFFVDLINKYFFNGAKDFIPAKKFTIFNIKNKKFLNAICYEATNKKAYKNNIKYLVVTSNFAWFNSFGAYFYNTLLKYYSLRYNKLIFHSQNL